MESTSVLVYIRGSLCTLTFLSDCETGSPTSWLLLKRHCRCISSRSSLQNSTLSNNWKTFQGFCDSSEASSKAWPSNQSHSHFNHHQHFLLHVEITSYISAFSGREDSTAPIYRLFSINDKHPGMVRVGKGETGAAVALEVSTRHPTLLERIFHTQNFEILVIRSKTRLWKSGETKCF